MARKHIYIQEDLVSEIERRGGSLSKMVDQGLRMLLGLVPTPDGQISIGQIESIARRVFLEMQGTSPQAPTPTKTPVPPEAPKYSHEVPDYVKPDEIEVAEPGVYRAASVCGALRISLAELMEDLDEEDLRTSHQHLGYFLDSTGVHTALATAARLDQDTTEFQAWFDKQA